MNTLQRLTTATAVACTAFLGASLAAQQPQPSPNPSPQTEPKPAPQLRTEPPDKPKADTSIKGELVKVDPMAKMLTIKTAAGKTEMVAYTDATTVTGAENGIAGLVNQRSTKVTVKFTGPDIARVATEIVVEKDKP
jgi:glucose/arabinose dehydrogenase